MNGWRSANLWAEHGAEEFVSKDGPAEEARAEVARAVSGRMGQLGVSTAELRRRSGLSVNTIRGITEGTSRHNRSTWVGLSCQHSERQSGQECHSQIPDGDAPGKAGRRTS